MESNGGKKKKKAQFECLITGLEKKRLFVGCQRVTQETISNDVVSIIIGILGLLNLLERNFFFPVWSSIGFVAHNFIDCCP